MQDSQLVTVHTMYVGPCARVVRSEDATPFVWAHSTTVNIGQQQYVSCSQSLNRDGRGSQHARS